MELLQTCGCRLDDSLVPVVNCEPLVGVGRALADLHQLRHEPGAIDLLPAAAILRKNDGQPLKHLPKSMCAFLVLARQKHRATKKELVVTEAVGAAARGTEANQAVQGAAHEVTRRKREVILQAGKRPTHVLAQFVTDPVGIIGHENHLKRRVQHRAVVRGMREVADIQVEHVL